MRASFLTISSICSTFIGSCTTNVEAADGLLTDHKTETFSLNIHCQMSHFAEAVGRISLREECFATFECLNIGVLCCVDC
jgi:hypothetical protein